MNSPRFLFVLKLITFIFFLFAFTYKTATFVDPDLGWHLRAGEIVAEMGHAPMIDHWNYVLTGQDWVDHEWLLDLLLWNAWTKGSWMIIISLFSLIAITPIFVWIFRARSSVQLLFVAFASGIIWTIIGIRPQVLSFLFFFLLYELIISVQHKRPKDISYFFLPILFFFWANIHAGFVAGLGLWVIVFLFRVYEKFRLNKTEFNYHELLNSESLSIIASIVATFFTPYHFGLWKEIILSTTSPLIAYIAEWQSPLAQFDIPLIIFLSSSTALMLASWKRLRPYKLAPAILFLLSYLEHARMAPFFLVTILPLTEQVIASLTQNTRTLLKELQPILRNVSSFIPAVLLASILAYDGTSTMLREPYQPPYEAIAALTSIPHTNCNIFNDYGMGGWMIFAHPNEKVFIDGRSPHWESKDGISPFREYVNLMKDGATWNTTFSKYNICMAILSPTSDLEVKSQNEQKNSLWMNAFKRVANLFYPDHSSASLGNTLEKSGWCKVYGDEKAIILTKPESPLCAYKEKHTTVK